MPVETPQEQVPQRTVELQHQSQLIPVSTQKGSEYATGEVSEKSVAFSQGKADPDGAFCKAEARRVNSGSTHADRAASREKEAQSVKERVQQRTPEPGVDVPVATQRQGPVHRQDRRYGPDNDEAKHMVEKVEMEC